MRVVLSVVALVAMLLSATLASAQAPDWAQPAAPAAPVPAAPTPAPAAPAYPPPQYAPPQYAPAQPQPAPQYAPPQYAPAQPQPAPQYAPPQYAPAQPQPAPAQQYQPPQYAPQSQYQPPAAPAPAMSQGGGEDIYLIDGTVLKGIITEFEGLKLKVSSNWRGVTKIQLGQMAGGYILDINDVDKIEWYGRDDEVKRRVQSAIEALAQNESFYQKLTIDGQVNLQFDNESGVDGFKQASNLTIGPGYDMRMEKETYGVYLRGRFDYTYQNGHSIKLHDIDVFSSISQPQQQQQQGTGGTGTTGGTGGGAKQQNQNGLQQFTQEFGSFAHAGYKHYLGGTPYFAFGEGQVAEEYEGYDLPWSRLMAGVGWGRISNIATVSQVKQIESYLISNGVIRQEFTRKTQKKLYFVFEENSNTQAIVQKVIGILKDDGYLDKNKDLTIDQAFMIAQIIDDAFRFRQDGLEAKAGFLYDITNPQIPTSDIANHPGYLYAGLEWDHPISDKIQFTEIAMVTFTLIGGTGDLRALSSSILDYKYSKELTLQASNTVVFQHAAANNVIDIVQGTARYYIAENVDINAQLTNMVGNITPAEAAQFTLNLSYVVPLSRGF